MTLFAQRRDDESEFALTGARNDVGRARAVTAHAHVERTVVAERKAARGLVELHRRDAEVEHDAVDRRRAADDGFQIGEPVLDQIEPALGLLDQIGAARDRALVAIDADDAGAGRRQDRAAYSRRHRRSRRRKVRRRERQAIRRRGGRAREYDEPIRQRQRGRRCPSSFPCSERFFRRHPGAQLLLDRAHRPGGLRELRAKAAGLPDLKFVAETDERHRVGDPAWAFNVSVNCTRPSPSIFSVSLVP